MGGNSCDESSRRSGGIRNRPISYGKAVRRKPYLRPARPRLRGESRPVGVGDGDVEAVVGPRPKVKRKFGLVEIEKVLSISDTNSPPRSTTISLTKRAGMTLAVLMSSCIPLALGCLIITCPDQIGLCSSAGGKAFTSVLPRSTVSESGSLACIAPQPPAAATNLLAICSCRPRVSSTART